MVTSVAQLGYPSRRSARLRGGADRRLAGERQPGRSGVTNNCFSVEPDGAHGHLLGQAVRFMNMEIGKENQRLKQRVKRLESALKAMLEVAWPNPDLPNSRTNRVIKRAQRVLRDAATRTKDVT